MIPSDPAILKDRLQSLFVCCCSMMSAAMDALVKSYHFKLKLEIGGVSNPGGALFVEIANRLKVDFKVVEVEPLYAEMPWVWLSDHTTKSQRAWIPEMRHREGDFHVLFPFYLRYHLGELRKHSPDFPSPEMDNLYLVLVWAECFGLFQAPLSARILKDLLAWDGTHLLTAHKYASSTINEIKTVHSKVTSLSKFSQLYLGFCPGALGWELTKGKEIQNHPFNRWTRQMLDIQQPGVGEPMVLPVMVRNFIWDIGQTTVITKNAWALQTHDSIKPQEEIPRTQRCLMLRLRGMSEDDIWQDLGFENKQLYYQWQISRLIDIDPKRFRDPFKDWSEACKSFEIEPDVDNLERPFTPAASIKEITPNSLSINLPSVPIPPAFRHSPDFRSVVAVDGRSFSLTEKQANVISVLYQAYENGTPELSQAYIIEEVYGTVSENRLKKLFADKEVWDALIEPGAKKGAIRLRIATPDNR